MAVPPGNRRGSDSQGELVLLVPPVPSLSRGACRGEPVAGRPKDARRATAQHVSRPGRLLGATQKSNPRCEISEGKGLDKHRLEIRVPGEVKHLGHLRHVS